MDLKFRRGYVKIPNIMFDELQDDSEYGKMFFTNFFVCNIHYTFDYIILGCKSKYFDEVEDGLKVPYYELNFEQTSEQQIPVVESVKKLDLFFL